MARYSEEKALSRYREERDYFDAILQAMRLNPEPTELDLLNLPVMEITRDHYDRIIRCVEEKIPFVGAYFTSAPEIMAAMDLPYLMPLATPFLATAAPYITQDIDNAEKSGLASDFCTAIRLGTYCVEDSLTPKPDAIIGMLYPCDGVGILHQIIEHNEDWGKVPSFNMDPPYHSDERSIQYFGEQLRQMVTFLEETTDRKMDWDRLREVVTESNKQYALWSEYNELRRATPCPHNWEVGGQQCFAVAQCFWAGEPKGTEWFEALVADAEKRIARGEGGVPDERIRMLWFDVFPMGWLFEFMPWLEAEWGVSVVLNMFGFDPYDQIDTSSEESMIMGLAKRNLCDTPMVRQARGVAENFMGDIERIVKDYKMDCVIWPGHMGHKDSAASVGLMREACRDLDVPFLHIGLDLFDSRYTSVDEVKNRISQFFTGMGLG